MRVVVLGLPCSESAAAVRAMAGAGLSITAIVVAMSAPSPDRRSHADLDTGPFLGPAGVPLVAVSTMKALTAELRRLRPDVIVAACFPWRLPVTVLEMAPLGCLNIHPSLLPRGRGPAPVFWTYRRGDRQTGVTVHLMDAGFDTGPILAQQGAEVPVGGRAPDLERALMAQGGRLLADVLPGWASGAIVPRPQDERQATAAPLPTAADFDVPTSWPAARAFMFAYGVAPLNGPLAVRQGEAGERIPVQDALDYHPDEAVAEAVADEGRGVVRVRFTPGWVRFLRAGAGRYPLSLSSFKAREKR